MANSKPIKDLRRVKKVSASPKSVTQKKRSPAFAPDTGVEQSLVFSGLDYRLVLPKNIYVFFNR